MGHLPSREPTSTARLSVCERGWLWHTPPLCILHWILPTAFQSLLMPALVLSEKRFIAERAPVGAQHHERAPWQGWGWGTAGGGRGAHGGWPRHSSGELMWRQLQTSFAAQCATTHGENISGGKKGSILVVKGTTLRSLFLRDLFLNVYQLYKRFQGGQAGDNMNNPSKMNSVCCFCGFKGNKSSNQQHKTTASISCMKQHFIMVNLAVPFIELTAGSGQLVEPE